MLPQELYDEVIDHLVGQVRTLVTCALVCKRWLLRCRYHLYCKVHLQTRRQLGLFYRSLNTDVSLRKIVASVSVHNPVHSSHTRYTGDDHIDLDIVSVLLVSILPNLDALLVTGHGDPSGMLHMGQITLRCATSLHMLSKLILHNLRFATLAALGRFVLGFPSLKVLHCTNVEVASHRHEHLVQAHTSRRLELSELNVSRHPACRKGR
ncbi:hypothetical protein K466DRAFT_221147 [Polyporus arcularius HHB13444]|uniref:F-box domain-containing protein n=1 Tax=Polyporus arcularius HHB13444 TaxID=1314778 RepID=A0A5C3P7L3_9APHY|nr:hypothetical protein K466DRAFT_221147 [Polyporus arcularius HHB13444]